MKTKACQATPIPNLLFDLQCQARSLIYLRLKNIVAHARQELGYKQKSTRQTLKLSRQNSYQSLDSPYRQKQIDLPKRRPESSLVKGQNS